MRQLLKYLRPYKKESVLAPLFKLLEATLELFVPLVMTAIIDRGIADKDDSYILWMGVVLFGLAAVGMTVSITAQYFAARAAVGFANDVKHAMFVHITKLSSKSVDRIGSSTLINRMTNDINQVSSGVNLFLRLFLRSPFIVLGAMVMAFTIDIKAAFIFVGVIPVLALIVGGCLYLTIPLYKNVQEQLDRVLSRTRENLTGVRVLRAFRRREAEKECFDRETGVLYERQSRVGRIAAWMNPLTLLVVNLAILLLIYVAGVRVEIGDLTQGQVVALVNYMSQILVELVKLANLILNINRALACANRIQEVFDLPEDGADATEEVRRPEDGTDAAEEVRRPEDAGEQGGIVCRNLHFTYPEASEEVLEGISFSVEEGETLGIIGGTGAGKSTILALLLKFYEGERGELSVLGRRMAEWGRKEIRDRIGFVPQKSVLFAGTIRENMLIGRADASDEEITKALKTAQAEEFVVQKGGLDALVSAGGANFSGGQRQRLCIARALLRNPRILLLDDSFSALDVATEAKLRTGLSEYFSGTRTTMVIVSQRIASVRQADRILVMDDGVMAGYGTHEELLAGCEVYREIHRIGGGS